MNMVTFRDETDGELVLQFEAGGKEMLISIGGEGQPDRISYCISLNGGVFYPGMREWKMNDDTPQDVLDFFK